jgi:F420-dependent oxidoreductase-like protein
VKLALAIGYSGADLHVPIELVQHAERLGFDSVWTAEAYGSDAITPLAWIAAQTERIRLGTGIMQLAGRTPAMCAMQCMTVDALAGGGRMIAGLGVSGPQIVEGWYGQPWGKPYWRLRDYIEIMRKIFERREPVAHEGREISLPYTGPGATGLGKPLRSIIHGDPALPIWMGSGKEATVRLTAELCDGWLPMHFVPGRMAEFRPWLEEGFARARAAGRDKGWHNFEIQAQVGVRVTDDVAGALAAQKPGIALYVGGMGAREVNFHNEHMRRMGYADAAERIQELFLAGRKEEAIAAVPDDYVDARCLVGPPDRIRTRYAAWADSGITSLGLTTRQPQALEVLADCAREHPAQGVDAVAAS